MKPAASTFVKSLPIFFSFCALEFIVFFFIWFMFHGDNVSIHFLRAFPLVIRIPVLTAFIFSLFATIFAKDQKYFFLAFCMNTVCLFIFTETVIFLTFPTPIELFYRLRYIITQ